MLTIRRAGPADGQALAAIAAEAYRGYVPRIGRPPEPMTADYGKLIEEDCEASGESRAAGAAEVWVACRESTVVGLLVLRSHSDHLLLENVAVLPAAQGSGVGARLLRHAEERAAASGLGEIRLYTNEAMTENIAYYSRHGYTETGRGGQHGFRRVFFAKQIAGA